MFQIRYEGKTFNYQAEYVDDRFVRSDGCLLLAKSGLVCDTLSLRPCLY